ncbi:MAG: hypothetical protein HY238_23950 [Acidobacteria bacterium]|nr:hypothetical protein [Acidobacteriota bacterium]
MTSSGGPEPDWRAGGGERIVIFPILALVCIAALAVSTVYLYLDLRTLRTDLNTEFNLTKMAQPQQVGDVRIKLKKVDLKRNRFTIEVWADDRKIEKKDKTVNEPVQFFVAQLRTPHELVVNQVQKDQLIGYLSTPKLPARR